MAGTFRRFLDYGPLTRDKKSNMEIYRPVIEHWVKESKRGDIIEHWVVIYAFLGLSFVDRLKMRSFCKLFHDVEKLLTMDRHGYKLLKPMPLRVEYPHPNFPSLNDLMKKLNEEYAALPSVWEVPTAPEMLSVGMKCQARFVKNIPHTCLHRELFKDVIIKKVNKDETFDIVVDDSSCRTSVMYIACHVPLNQIRIQNVSLIVL